MTNILIGEKSEETIGKNLSNYNAESYTISDTWSGRATTIPNAICRYFTIEVDQTVDAKGINQLSIHRELHMKEKCSTNFNSIYYWNFI